MDSRWSILYCHKYIKDGQTSSHAIRVGKSLQGCNVGTMDEILLLTVYDLESTVPMRDLTINHRQPGWIGTLGNKNIGSES